MNLFRRFASTSSRSASRVLRPTPRTSPRAFYTTGFTTFPASQKVEEENWPWYTPTSFYPVRIGDVLHSKYHVLFKLGYGTTSTTWMCRDICRDEYVCMKALVCDYSSAQREVEAYEILSKNSGSNTNKSPGHLFVRQPLDRFQLRHAGNDYRFLIHEPLGVTLQVFLAITGGTFTAAYTKVVIRKLLHALEFIHSSDVIHADLQASNILLRIQDESIFKEAEAAERAHPSARKITNESVIFETREPEGAALRRLIGPKSDPVLCDFGEARTGRERHMQDIQPPAYRAPEVFLHVPWHTSVDIWNLGCLTWHMVCGRHLFSRQGAPDESAGDRQQLAWMATLLGPPPAQLLADSGSRALEFFRLSNTEPESDGTPGTPTATATATDSDATAIAIAIADVNQNETLETLLARSLAGTKWPRLSESRPDEETAAFLAFIRRMLQWDAEDRASAAELLSDPWMVNNYK